MELKLHFRGDESNDNLESFKVTQERWVGETGHLSHWVYTKKGDPPQILHRSLGGCSCPPTWTQRFHAGFHWKTHSFVFYIPALGMQWAKLMKGSPCLQQRPGSSTQGSWTECLSEAEGSRCPLLNSPPLGHSLLSLPHPLIKKKWGPPQGGGSSKKLAGRRMLWKETVLVPAKIY